MSVERESHIHTGKTAIELHVRTGMVTSQAGIEKLKGTVHSWGPAHIDTAQTKAETARGVDHNLTTANGVLHTKQGAP